MDQVLQQILDAFGGIKKSENEIQIHCPCHDDSNPSCGVTKFGDGSYVSNCFSGCDSKQVFAAIVAVVSDAQGPSFKSQVINKAARKRTLGYVFPGMPDPPDHFPDRSLTIDTRYVYTTLDGKSKGLIVYRLLNSKGEKDIRPLSAAESKSGEMGWSWCWPDDHPYIYGLSGVDKDLPLVIVEGEKCVEKAKQLLGDEYSFISWSGGSGTWGEVDWEQINWEPPEIIIWPDNDIPGLKWAIEGGSGTLPLATILQDMGHMVNYIDPTKYEWNKGYDIADAIIDNLDIPAIFSKRISVNSAVLGKIYSLCAVARAQLIGPEEIKGVKCGFFPECSDCTYNHVSLIETPLDFLSYDDFMYNWCYIEASDMMQSLVEGERYLPVRNWNRVQASTIAAIDDEKRLPSTIFMDNPNTLKVRNKTFRPKQPAIVLDPDPKYNHWQPNVLNEEPNLNALQLYQKLCEHIIPNNNTRNHFYDWCAFNLQHPEEKISHQIIFISPVQGVGKDSIIAPIMWYFGKHSRAVYLKELSGSFNSYLDNKKFLLLDELNTSAKNLAEQLKPLAAGGGSGYVSIEKKGETVYEVPNIVSLFGTSNKALPMYLGDRDDRRWFIMHFEGKPLDQQFYTNYYESIGKRRNDHKPLHPGITGIIQWFMDRDVKSFNPGAPAPMTDYKQEVQAMSNPLLSWVKECIQDEQPPFDSDIITCEWFKNILRAEQPKVSNGQVKVLAKELGWVGMQTNVPKDMQAALKIPGTRNIRYYIIRRKEMHEGCTPKERLETLKKYIEGLQARKIEHIFMYSKNR